VRISTLTSWEGADAGGSNSLTTIPVLVGLISADGTEEWVVSMARPESVSTAPAVWVEVASSDDAVVTRLDAQVEQLSDDSTLLITAPITVPPEILADPGASVRWHHDGHSETIVLAP
jgi:hypothetical protein